MLPKLSLRNIRRSVKDYTIYFVTLVFGVAVFYAFSSIGNQRILFDIEESASASIFDTTQTMLGGFSVVIALVLGFLVVYANRFLIKRRKHEFGIYLTLGMSPREASAIVLLETVIVGLVSMAVGLVCGVLLSQALSFASAALFNLKMEHYQFVFSESAFLTTLGCFVAIYVVVALFNLFAVNRYKLIDLLSAHARNERTPVRNPWVCLVAFVVSLGILALAYLRLIENGLVMLDTPEFVQATVLMLVGSLVFFWSLAGFLIGVLQRVRGVYLRGLAMFTVRQIASKVNTAFLSLWVVCVMLFFTITTFATGMGLVEVFWGDAEEASPYDATLAAQVYYGSTSGTGTTGAFSDAGSAAFDERARAMQAEYPEEYADGVAFSWNMEEKLRSLIPNWNDFVARSVQVDGWELPGQTYGMLMSAVNAATSDEGSNSSISNTSIGVMGVSQVNALLEMLGREPLQLGDDECIMANNMALTEGIARAAAENRYVLDAMGHQLTTRGEVLNLQVQNNAMLATPLMFVVPDYVVDELRDAGALPLQSFLNIDYPESITASEGDAALYTALANALPLGGENALDADTAHADDGYERSVWPATNVMTAQEMFEQAGGLRMMITYLALYIGFVFLVATAAILAIQQLSEAADAQPRYKLLAHLGCDTRMLNRSLLIQVLVYFAAPLALAASHAACAIGVMSDSLLEALGTPIEGPVLMAAAFVVAIYGGYFLVTYFASRTIVRQAISGK